NKHANTQVPKVAGFARIAKVDNDLSQKEAARFFWDRVTKYRSVVIGGNSRSEHFPAADDYISFVEHREGPESCNTHNMLKLTEFLFSIDPLAEYADYYEKAMYNHILSTQHPEHGGYVYFTSMRPSHYRVYSQVNSGMWCCIGTGMENHGKYGEFIYTHEGDSELHVNLFVASRLNWKENRATITQETNFPFEESSKITVNLKKSKKFKMFIRCPEWTDAGYCIKINGKVFDAEATPQSYIEIDRKWKNGDVVEISLPMKTVIEELANVPQYLAVKKGPIVLAAKTGTENLDGLIADDGRWAHIASGPLVPIAETPIMVGTREQIEQKIFNMQPVPGKPLHYTVAGLFNDRKYDTLELEPFFYLHDSRYAIYFLSLTREGFNEMLDEIRADEAAMLALDARTVDKVTPGEQQPEADHRMQGENSSTGNESNKPYRTIRRGGYFSYEMDTYNLENLALSVGYWGSETANPNFSRAMDILVDDELIISETAFPSTGQKKIERKEYILPKSSLQGKDRVRITFRSQANAMAARIFDVRLVKED
ncbi:MAG: glycoside hydrolase family 127 protein, partial [Bacteroidales bacterium]|nr:glycoside hydrolase family 127 protein [Bacteroidales bacterium]